MLRGDRRASQFQQEDICNEEETAVVLGRELGWSVGGGGVVDGDSLLWEVVDGWFLLGLVVWGSGGIFVGRWLFVSVVVALVRVFVWDRCVCRTGGGSLAGR